MKKAIIFLLIAFPIFMKAQSNQFKNQPKLSLDSDKNIYYQDPTTKEKKTIFPVMLYSFYNWDEVKENTDWSFLKKFGVNLVYSWDLERQNIFYRKANESKTLVLLDHSSSNKQASFYSFPEEPIGAGTADFKQLSRINKVVGNGVLKFMNVDVGPYFYRKKHDKNKDPFESKYNCSWCNQRKGSTLSYDESVKFSDIVSFDYYPYRAGGYIADNVGDYGKTSVGEFTRLLKKRYPKKSVWAVIQTLWFEPFSDQYKGNVITLNIIRNLTFDAIVNGADGVSFFGHGQTQEYEKKKGYEFLKSKSIGIWKDTLFQTYELGQLQEQEYDCILLEDNLYSFTDPKNGYSYSIKKVKHENKYYIFVVNHLKKDNQVEVKFPNKIGKISTKDIKKVGVYNIPALEPKWKADIVDFTRESDLVSVKPDRLNIKLGSYSVGIFTVNAL